MIKKSKNLKKCKKNHFFKRNLKIWKRKNFGEKRNAIILVLPIEEISLRPDLSSPARFRIQGVSPERDTGAGGVAGWY